MFSSCELIFRRHGCEVIHRFCENLSRPFTLDSGGRAFMFSILLNWNIIVCWENGYKRMHWVGQKVHSGFLYDVTDKSKRTFLANLVIPVRIWSREAVLSQPVLCGGWQVALMLAAVQWPRQDPKSTDSLIDRTLLSLTYLGNHKTRVP